MSVSTVTPRRITRRSGITPLPAVGLRPSTAYGTNTAAQPSRAAGPQVNENLTNVLTNLLSAENAVDGSELSDPIINHFD